MYTAPKSLENHVKNMILKALEAANEADAVTPDIIVSKLVDFARKTTSFNGALDKHNKECNKELSRIARIVATRISDNATIVHQLVQDETTIASIIQRDSLLKRTSEQVFSDIMSQHKRAKENWGAAVCAPDNLTTYASAATAMGEKAWVKAGINWMEETIVAYYTPDGLKKAFIKGVKAAYYDTHKTVMPHDELNVALTTFHPIFYNAEHKIRVLDIGSCYNPFVSCGSRALLEVTAMDLCPNPEVPSVLEADFLTVPLGATLTTHNNALTQLPCRYYDAVTLSLVLSYLPTSAKRVQMLTKVHTLLALPSAQHAGGLLLIAEKVSIFHRGHVKCQFRDAWMRTIASMGFQLMCYREHVVGERRMHWMAFRRATVADCDSNSVDASGLIVKQEAASEYNVGDSGCAAETRP